MAEFEFKLADIFREPIIKVSPALVPLGMSVNRNASNMFNIQIDMILNRMGERSADAQQLRTPITTMQRVREATNQQVYLLADVKRGARGQVCALLKIGLKHLFLYDKEGLMRNVPLAPSILDFYVHESCQRCGYGRRIFQYMLDDMGWTPVQCAIDRPSDKMRAFMDKHFNLRANIRQLNNFVVYEGFFEANKVAVSPSRDNRYLLNRSKPSNRDG